MWSDRLSTFAAVVLLVAAGSAAWWFQLRAPLRPEAASLATLPHRLASFEGIDTPVEDTVEQLLRADFNVQREYAHPLGQVVWLYIGYYGTERGGTPEHTPRACYRTFGWEIVDEATLAIDPGSGLTGKEYLVELQGQQQLVLYWYRSFRSTGMLSTLSLRFDHVVGQLSTGRGDGALVRLSTPLMGSDRAAARALLLAFARILEPELAKSWPSEATGAGERAVATR